MARKAPGPAEELAALYEAARSDMARGGRLLHDEAGPVLSAAGLKLTGTEGLIYDPFADEWRLAIDTDVNYFATAMRA